MADSDESVLPSAPQNPLKFEGYSNIGFLPIKNHDFDLSADTSNEVRPKFQNVPHLSEEEAKTALAQFVSEHCCYGKGPVNDLKFTNFESSNTHRYVLQTYTETRSTAYTAVPYSGQPIILSGQPVQPWEIPVAPKALFSNETHKIEIPNTAHVENCGKCFGVGNKQCMTCQGRGSKICWVCDGKGCRMGAGFTNSSFDSHHGDIHIDNHHHHHHQPNHFDSSRCSTCNGTGFTGCTTCNRSGRVKCGCCKGSGKLKWFLELTVTFLNNQDDFIKKSSVIPDELLRKCQGQNVFSEQNPRIYPIRTYHDAEINQASFNLLNTHASKFNNCKILAQRHEIYVIPVTLCTYEWNDETHTFHVFGLNRRVYAPDYPKKCCCTIL